MTTAAVIVSENGFTADIFSGNEIEIYKISRYECELVERFAYTLDNSAGLAKMRQNLLAIAESLKKNLDTHDAVIIGSNVTGIPYNIFDSLGFTIFEISGRPENFLCELCSQLETRKKEIHKGETSVNYLKPVEVKNGVYCFDLKTLQIKKPGLTSMKVLMPFFKNESFSKLDIVCAHVPLWFDREFGKLNLEYSTKRVDETLHVIVVRKNGERKSRAL